MLALAEVVEQLDVVGDHGVYPEEHEDGRLHRYLSCIALIIHDHQVHEDIAKQEQQPLPEPRSVKTVEVAEVHGSIEWLALWPRMPVVQGVVDVSFGFFETLHLSHILNDFPGDADDVVTILVLEIRVLVIFGLVSDEVSDAVQSQHRLFWI